MATASKNKSIYAPSGSTAWTLHIEFTAGTQSVANNTTSITVKGSLKSGGGSFSSGSSNKLTIYWHDNNTGKDTSWGSTSTSAMSSGATISKSVTKTVTHKSDGTLSGYAKVVWSKNDGNNWTPASGNVSTSTVALTTIPRTSTPTMGASSYTVTASSLPTLVVKTNRASTALSHRASITINGTRYPFNNDNPFTTDTCSWAMTSAARTKLLQTIPNATQYTATVTLTTYSGSKNLGSKTCTVVLKLTNSFGPTISLNGPPIEELNESLTSLPGFTADTIVKGLSEKKIGVIATAANSATVSSVKIQNGSVSVNATLTNGVYYATFVSSQLTSATFTATVTDTRGYTASVAYTGTLTDYIFSSISDVIPYRNPSKSNYGYVNVEGKWFNGSIGNSQNTLTAEYQYGEPYSMDQTVAYAVDDTVFYNRKLYSCASPTYGGNFIDANWTEVTTYSTLSITSNGNNFTATNHYTTDPDHPEQNAMDCSYERNYVIKVRIYDAITGIISEQVVNLGAAIPVLWMGERTIRVGGAAIMNYLGMPGTSGENIIDGGFFERILSNNGRSNNGVISTSGGTITLPDSSGVYMLLLSGTNNFSVSDKAYLLLPSQNLAWCISEVTQYYSLSQAIDSWASRFTNYDDSSIFWRRNGICGFRLIAKNSSSIAYSTSAVTICTLVPSLRPRLAFRLLSQGSSNNIFMETVNTSGTITFSRYRNGGADATMATGTWINLDAPGYIAAEEGFITVSITNGTTVTVTPKLASLRYHLIRIY